jgi:regulatory protein
LKSNVSDPFGTALRLLARRERSSQDLAARLRQRGFLEKEIAATLERCRALGYLDDPRFARSRARTLLESGRAVGGKLLGELARHGIDPEVAAAALAEAAGSRDQRTLLAELVERRYPDFSWAAAEDRERRRVVNYFQRRGFPLPLVLSFFRQER